jgi:hypothetical protein
MPGEASEPTSGRGTALRLDGLASILAALTAVTGAVALIVGSEFARRGTAIPVVVGVAAFAGGVGLLLAFRNENVPRRLRRLRSAATVVLLALAFLCFVVLIIRAEQSDSRPVITATATGDGPLTISGEVTAEGLGSTERVAIKVVDQNAIPFQAVAGAEPHVGRALIPFTVRLNGRPDRDITVVAWLMDRVAVEPTCNGAQADPGNVTCVHLALLSPTTIAPILTLVPYLGPGPRTVTVTVGATVGPDDGVQVNLWDRDLLLQSFIARPGVDGKVNESAVVPLHEDRAVLCAVAEIVPQATAKTVPSPCLATTFVQLIIQPAPGFVPPTPGPSASATAP